MMPPEELIARIASTLRGEIGPAVSEEYPRTQAFMAAVILERVARQLRLAPGHVEVDHRERMELFEDLERLLPTGSAPASLVEALAAARGEGGKAALCRFVEALYAVRAELGDERFEAARARLRATLRARLDREVAFAA